MTKIAHNLSPKKAAFLAAYAESGVISRAADAAGVARRTHYDWMHDDPDYPEMFEQAHREACQALEAEARRRAVEGWDEPVFGSLGANSGSGEVGVRRKFSDTLLIFLMKGAMPEKYGDRIQHTGDGGGPIQTEVIGGMSRDQIRQVHINRCEALLKRTANDDN